MKRRLLLLIGSLGAILVVFAICLWIVGLGEGRPEAAPLAPEAALPSRAPASRETMAPQEGTDFRAVTRDKEGRLKRLFTAPYYENKGQGVYVLNEPKAVIYQSDGQQIQISAEQGTIHTESRRMDEGSVRLAVKQGELQGHVRVYFDRSTDPDRPPVELRTTDPNVLIASADNIHFDNERLLLYTNDRVRVTSQQIEMSGRGFSVRWNEDPQELQVLRLEQGDGMVIRYVPGEEVEFLALPGGGRLGVVTDQNEMETAPLAPPEAIDEEAAMPLDEEPSPPPPIKEAVERQPPSRHRARNVYTAEFRGDVQVKQGNRYVHGADKLAVEFQWASSRRDEDRPEPPARVTPGELVIPPGGSEVLPATEPVAEPPAKVEATTAPASQPMGEPVTITWTGPLEIVPTGYTENPSRKNVAVSGQGTSITLFDGNTTALCQQFEFRRRTDPAGDRRQGWLAGTADCPALLALAGGEEIVCRSMRFELASTGDTARLEGEGYIARPAGGEELPGSLTAAERGPEGQTPPGNFECISWMDSVNVMLARDESARGEVYIRQAHFRGDVELSGSDRGEGLRCDRLHVGVERRKTAGGRGGVRTSVRSILAEGNVLVRGGQGEGKWRAFAGRLWGDPAEGMAMLTGDPARLTSRNSALSGKEIHFRAFKDVDGSFIRGAGLARVAGEGELQMPVDKDLSGTQLATPRLATITWTEEMRYIDYGRSTLGPREGQEGAPAMASFSGQVHLVSGNEEMTCEEMRATFTGPAAPAGPADKSPTKAPRGDSRSLNLGTINYGGSLWKVYAYQDVVLKSHRRDRQGRMLGLAELRTNSLVYDAVAKMADADDGWMLVQDIRPPQEEQEKPQGGGASPSDQMPAGDLESPSQTYFEWSKAMHLGMETRLVQLTGDVWMRHAGGDQIVERDSLKEKWSIQDWPDPLPAGRLTDLRCDSLLAQFAPPTPSRGAKTLPAASEPNAVAEDELRAGLNLIGPLDLFVAKGSVLLKDDPWEVIGEKLTYERKQDVVTVLGSADGKSQANARISRVEQDRVVTNESPWVRWYRKNRTRKDDRVETGPMTGSGVILPPSSSKGR